MWFKKIIIRRKLASSDARTRMEAVSALDVNDDLAQIGRASCRERV